MFDQLVGNRRAKDVLRRMLGQGRVPGALLFAGEEGVGKKLFALELARALNCRRPAGVEACGECSSCARIGKFSYPPEDDRDEHKKVIWSEHRDVGMIIPYKRSILVDAARDLERETNFRPYEGAARVFLVDDADRLNEAASNALLKTLEEMPPSSYLVLLASRPASLLATIRSRCQTVRFAPLAPEEIEEHLVASRRRAGEEARLAAQLSRGRLGLALEMNLDDYRERREPLLGVLEALTLRPDRVRLLRAAEELSDAKRKDDYEPRLDVLETLVHDLWLLSVGRDDARVVNVDVRSQLARMADGLSPSRASRWLGRVEELRAQLAVNVNRRVATDALFISMASD
ncbi:MAG TPA: DNA polymerase III subunit delta' [Pyrinomonadaceae bacterium]|nr:DNA polymerase III subunit delta' [Pyrinomonadaceae bacterium]